MTTASSGGTLRRGQMDTFSMFENVLWLIAGLQTAGIAARAAPGLRPHVAAPAASAPEKAQMQSLAVSTPAVQLAAINSDTSPDTSSGASSGL